MDYKSSVEEYQKLLNSTSNRKKECLSFAHFLEEHTNWLTAPASTRFHLPQKGGLLFHSVGVCKNLLRLKELLAPTIPDDSCIISGLFHDVGKAGLPHKPLYHENTSENTRSFPFKVNKELSSTAVAMRSAYLLARYLPLAPEELQAVLYHDGQYIPEGEFIAHQEEALTLLLHWADYWTAHIEEEGHPIRISSYSES